MKKIFIVLSLLVTTNLFATKNLNLQQAREQGLVCENLNGLIIATGSSTHEIVTLINEVNTKRLIKYREIAAKDKTALSQVQAAAGKKQIQNAELGRFIMDEKTGLCIKKK